MALARVMSCAVVGLEGSLVEVEVDVTRSGLPSMAIVGLPVACGVMHYPVDMSHIKGQEHVKRALEVAAAGGHNLL